MNKTLSGVYRMQSKIVSEKRDRMRGRQVRGKAEGYNSYLETGGIRFNGRAAHVGDRQLALEGNSMPEPDWSSMTLVQLQAAEKMARHRMSGGESSWKGVLERIRSALRIVERKERSNRG